MDKQDLDRMYHNLRLLSTTDDTPQKEAVLGITRHLTLGGDYIGLLRFLSYYGEEYVLPHAVAVLKSSHMEFNRIVDFGAGLCWLGRGIANAFGNIPAVFVDKRQWIFIDIVADLETNQGRERVLQEMKDGDLIVMSEFLHCLDKPRDAMKPFSKWPMLVIEYSSTHYSYQKSYKEQLKKYGARPLSTALRDVFPGSRIVVYTNEPYAIALVTPL